MDCSIKKIIEKSFAWVFAQPVYGMAALKTVMSYTKTELLWNYFAFEILTVSGDIFKNTL